jgi:hypothetical protein
MFVDGHLALAVPAAAPAMAQPRGRPGPDRHQYYYRDNRDDSGAWIGGALLGLGVGVMLGGTLAPPPPRYYAPPPVIYYGYGG